MASGVWFFRVGLLLWLFLNRGPVDIDMATFRGPFLTSLNFAQSLMPLGVFEVYWRTRNRSATMGRMVMAASLWILTVLMGIGIVNVNLRVWLPRLMS